MDGLDNFENLETPDGRKVTSIATSGISVALETGAQAAQTETERARARKESVEAEIAEMKLASMKRGIGVFKMR